MWNIMKKLSLQQNRDRIIDKEQADSCGEGLGSGRIQQKGKRIHGHGQQCGDFRGEGDYKQDK